MLAWSAFNITAPYLVKPLKTSVAQSTGGIRQPGSTPIRPFVPPASFPGGPETQHQFPDGIVLRRDRFSGQKLRPFVICRFLHGPASHSRGPKFLMVNSWQSGSVGQLYREACRGVNFDAFDGSPVEQTEACLVARQQDLALAMD